MLRVVLLDGGFFRELDGLEPENFSSPLLGKIYALLRTQWKAGRSVSLAALEGQLSPEELDELTAIMQEPQARNTAQKALKDCKQTILLDYQRREDDIHSVNDLLKLRQAQIQKKAYGG